VGRATTNDNRKSFRGANITRKFDFIDPDLDFRVLNEWAGTVKGNEQNLGYNGIIYLLVDEDVYSSAGAFSSFSTKTDRIKTIGMPTGKLLGMGATPNLFILPHSRLIFRMHLMLDATNVKSAECFYHDRVTYSLTPSIEYYKYWYDPERSISIDKETMYDRDKVFIKAIEIINSHQRQ
jgi:hypothetical protein